MATTSCDDNALLPTNGGVWHGAIVALSSFTGRRAQEKEVPSDEEEEALDIAEIIARIKQPADRRIRSSCIDPKRDPNMIAPRRATGDEDDFRRPKEKRPYESIRSQSKSWIDFEGIHLWSPSSGDKSTATFPGSEVSDTFSPPSKVRSDGGCKGFAGSSWFSDNIVVISKVNDTGTESTSQPSSEEEEALVTAATISRIKQTAACLIRSSSIHRKRGPSTIVPRSATVDDFERPKEQRRYDSIRSKSKSWIDFEGTCLDSPSFGDKSTETSTTSEVSDTVSPPSTDRAKGAYTGFAGSGWFSDNIVAISKVNDSGTENASQSTFSSNPSGKLATSTQCRSSLSPMCGMTQTTMPSEEGEQKACLTYVSSSPTGRQRCVIVVVIIGIVFFAVPLITLAARGCLRDNDGKSSPAGSPISNPNTGSDSKADIFRYRVPHSVGGG